jgi:L-ascorbate metabolism protein UlaG (beta-lactamase superfamily)
MEYLHKARKQGRKFLNPVETSISTGGNIFNILWKYATNKAETIPAKKLGPFVTDVNIYKTPPSTGLRITWIGHSSILIEIDGLRILTDPVWSNRASFSEIIGPKRFFDAPLKLAGLPHLDAILISHDHYDHLDPHVIKTLAAKQIPFYCPLQVAKYLISWGVSPNLVTEMDWTDTVAITNNCQLTALPTRHFSGRSLFNRNETLWCSYVIKTNNHNIYYGADSGLYNGFKEIGDAYGPFNLTMLEIGAYNENWANIHMGPKNAIQAHLELKGQLMMPIHWGTFNLALHAWNEPVEDLINYAAEKDVKLFIPKPGEPTTVTGSAYNSSWWKQ